MKAVILAAGKGTRMGGLTTEIPKPLLTIRGKTLIEYKIDVLPEEIDEVVLIVGYLGDKIKERFGGSYNGRKITYIEAEPRGTAYALWQAKHLLDDRFLLMNGDDLYAAHDISECLKYEQSALLKEVPGPMSGGKTIIKDGFVDDMIEGKHPEGGIISTGLFVFSPGIFKYPMQKMPGREELGIPPTVIQAKKELPMKAVFTSFFKQVTAPEDLEMTDEELAPFLPKSIAKN